MEDLIVLGAIALVVGAMFLLYIFRALFYPMKLDQIKKLIDSGDYEKAIKQLENFIRKDERNPLAHLYLADCYYNIGNYEMAMVEYKQVLRLGKFSKSVTERYVRERIANLYLRLGQLEEAQKEFLLLAKIEPDNYTLYYSIGEIFYERNYKEQAMAYLLKALKLNPQHADSYFLLGKIYYEMKKINDAQTALANCVKYAPRNYEAHYFLGLVYKILGNYTKAMQEFETAERTSDNDLKVKAIYQLGLAHLELGNTEKAIAEFQRALKFAKEENNTTIAVRYALAQAYEKQRKLLEAVEQWEKIAQFRPNYLDVQQKLAQYEDLRLDDRLKDFMTASPATFEIIAQNVVKAMDYDILSSEVVGDNVVNLLAAERAGKWRNVRPGRAYIMVTRENNPIDEGVLAMIIDKMKSAHATKGVCITSSRFTPRAVAYAENRPLVLVDRQKLSQLLRKV